MTERGLLILFASWIIVSNAVTAMNDPWDGFYKWFRRFSFGVIQVVKSELDKNPKFAALTQTVETPDKVVTTVAEAAK